jgi:7-cyano-7-deazaguanine synthase in queuosine biosynthesis
MRKHAIICRYGLKDTKGMELLDPNSHRTKLQFVTGNKKFGHGIGAVVTQLQKSGLHPSEAAFDLLVLAATVFCADTRINRQTESQDSWTREVDIYMPTKDPELWRKITPVLRSALEFLTGDKWNFLFRPRPKGFDRIIKTSQRELPVDNNPKSTCLFSGGLDSYIGAIDLYENDEQPLLVSHSWVNKANHDQHECLKALQSEYGTANIRRLKGNIGFEQGIIRRTASEETERSRSFLFFSLAAIAASAIPGETTIYVPENGLISLNVPLDPLRLGSLSTRTTHPFFMARFNDILRALGITATLVNPYRHKTKGDMVKECKNQEFLAATAGLTTSCSSPNKARWQKLPPGHCGYCVPCLIRQAAFVGWSKDDPTTYHQDLSARRLNPNKPEGAHIRSFQLAIQHLNNRPARAAIMIHKSGPLTDCSDEITKLAAMYLKGMQEVGQLLKDVRT